jgi:hypothetical protein
VVGEVVQAQRDRLRDEQPEQPLARGWLADALPVLGVHALDDEAVQPPAVGAEHAQRAVGRVHVTHGGADDLVQGRLEVAAGGRRPDRSGELR